MILTCPQCATRYQADAAKFQPAGRNVRCAKCAHLWHQDPPPPEPDAAGDTVAAPEPAPPPPAAAPVPAPRPTAFVPNPVIAREVPPPQASEPRARSRWPMRLAVGLGWLGLIALVLAVGWSALAFRRQIATIWPQSASLYAAMGMKTNANGIDIHDVAFARVKENGQPMLTVSGKLTNNSAHELPVPQIRAVLTDNDNRELYRWTIVPGVLTLRPGQTASFVKRLSDAPEGARHVELRFAREGE